MPGLEVSLFERLLTLRCKSQFLEISQHALSFGLAVPLVTLDTQYRMHPSISQFVSTEFYDGLLQDGTVDRHGNPHLRFSAPISSYSERIGGLNILFLDHDSRETKRGGSWYNSPEATLVLQYVEDLLLQNPVSALHCYPPFRPVILTDPLTGSTWCRHWDYFSLQSSSPHALVHVFGPTTQRAYRSPLRTHSRA